MVFVVWLNQSLEFKMVRFILLKGNYAGFVFEVSLEQIGKQVIYCFSAASLPRASALVSAALISEQPCHQTLKGDGWTALLKPQLTASPFSLAREKQLLEGESIFISPLADGSRIDIKGDSAMGEEWS